MRDLKGSGLTDRLAAAAEAKAALLAKLKPRATVTDPLFDQRGEMRAAELKAARDARAAQKEAVAQAKADAHAVVQADLAAADDAALAEKRGARKERKQLSKAEGQAKRDARYAARKARR
jgi:predicted house-cleaning NTP pyrophosphatase (Maf/HAM1 superfamily)